MDDICYLCRSANYGFGRICPKCGAVDPRFISDTMENISTEEVQSEIIKGYHKKLIKKGELGKPSKIREEFEEFMDAIEQDNPVMALIELSDLIGAIEAYAERKNISLDDLITMKDATKRAFKTGHRK